MGRDEEEQCWRKTAPLPQQVELIFTYLLRAKLARSTMEMFGELLNRVQVATCGARRGVAALEFFEHPVSELSHNDLLVTLTLSATSAHPLGRHHAASPRQRLMTVFGSGTYLQ
jgi:hypothetical protein